VSDIAGKTPPTAGWEDRPQVLRRCPVCNARPFYGIRRGRVHSWWRWAVPEIGRRPRFPFFGLTRRACCSVICSQCHETVGYEKP
jgi:hypothetical protein